MTRLRAVALISLALTAAFAAGVLVPATRARARVPCGPSNAPTLAGDAHVRVYAAGGVAFGCATGGKKSFRLGVRSNCIGSNLVGPVVVAGAVAAYGSERCGVDMGSTQVVVRNLTTGSRLSASPAVEAPGPESFASVSSLVVRPDGAAAWIAVANSLGTHRSTLELWRVSARGTTALLDSGSAVTRRSLRLRGDKLSWTHGGRPRSCTLA